MAELASLLTEFAKNGDVIPDIMEAGELLDLDCENRLTWSVITRINNYFGSQMASCYIEYSTIL